MSIDEVNQWLTDARFHRNGDWLCDGDALPKLSGGEIIAQRSLHYDGGITFVE